MVFVSAASAHNGAPSAVRASESFRARSSPLAHNASSGSITLLVCTATSVAWSTAASVWSSWRLIDQVITMAPTKNAPTTALVRLGAHRPARNWRKVIRSPP
jgi:hypothetical protein